MSKKIMTKNTDKQAIDNLADNFNGYAALLRKIKQRVLVAQQRAIYAANEEMLRMYIGILEVCCSKVKMQMVGARKPCNACPWT